MNAEKYIIKLQEIYGDDFRKVLENIDKERIILKAISKKKKENLSNGSITTTYMGINTVCRYQVLQTEKENITIPLTPGMLMKAGVAIDELFDLALKNTLRYNPPVIQKTYDFISFLNENHDVDEEDVNVVAEYLNNVYSVTGRYGGAAIALFDNETLRKLAEEINDDIVLIPESEELLFAVGVHSKEGLSFIENVIHYQLYEAEEETRLSEYVYFYGKESGKVRYGCIDKYVSELVLG